MTSRQLAIVTTATVARPLEGDSPGVFRASEIRKALRLLAHVKRLRQSAEALARREAARRNGCKPR
jgi:hypothetical protein